MWYLWRITQVLETIWRYIQVRNESPTVVFINKPFKSSSCDNGEEREEQVGDHLMTNEEPIELPAENDDHV